MSLWTLESWIAADGYRSFWRKARRHPVLQCTFFWPFTLIYLCWFGHWNNYFCNVQVFNLLLSIEQTPISVATSRKVTLLVSRIQASLSAPGTTEVYVLPAFYGIIGLLYNQYSDLSNSAIECLSVMISKYPGILWNRFISFFEQCQTSSLKTHGLDISNIESCSETTGLWLFLFLLVWVLGYLISLLLKFLMLFKNPESISFCHTVFDIGWKVISFNCLLCIVWVNKILHQVLWSEIHFF